KGTKVAIIGDFARTPRYQGAGSSLVKNTRLDCFYDCVKAAGLNIVGYAQGYRRDTVDADPQLIAEAAKLAKSAEIVLLCVGLDETTESEGMDRSGLELATAQQALINAVSAANPNIILVLSGGAPFIMPERSLYRAAIHGYLGGQAGGAAMADAIVGKVNPSGKLSETWPLRIEDTPAYPYSQNRQRTFEYREALYVGYRYYDSAAVPVRYPFGHGLSYTTFEYSDIAASVNEVSFTIKNTGMADAAEIAQVYVSCPEGKVFRPRKELKGFAKVFLKAGESRRVSISLDDKAFRYFNVKTNTWETESGSYEIFVAASAADVRLSQSIYVHGSDAPLPYGELPHYESAEISTVPDDEFAALLGRYIPDGTWGSILGINDALCQLRLVKTVPAQLVYKIVHNRKEKGEKQCPPDLNSLFIYNMTFRSIAKLTNGMISFKMAEDLCLALNGHFFRGAGRFILDFLRSKRQSKAFLRELESQK
ncbi:MAG: glycoside hydrolase family 3 C-terminal domain-containing protein, partial [Oscillospiraceae bacterium]|nr:glycoside hydrolase family 3 C-terminal domain-containing protein [Oscillospiraceae bacterium]